MVDDEVDNIICHDETDEVEVEVEDAIDHELDVADNDIDDEVIFEIEIVLKHEDDEVELVVLDVTDIVYVIIQKNDIGYLDDEIDEIEFQYLYEIELWLLIELDDDEQDLHTLHINEQHAVLDVVEHDDNEPDD